MNAELLEKAVYYHGKKLFELILKQNNCPMEPSEQNFEAKTNNEITDVKERTTEQQLKEKILKFTAKKSDYLFSEKFFPEDCKIISESHPKLNRQVSPQSHRSENTEINANSLLRISDQSDVLDFGLAPIDTYMEIPQINRQECLSQLIEKSDIVIGKIDYLSEEWIFMNLVCFDNHKQINLTGNNYKLLCPLSNAIKALQKHDEGTNSPPSNFLARLETVHLPGDYLRCAIVNIDNLNHTCEVSLSSSKHVDVELGEVAAKKLPVHYQNILDYEKEPYPYGSQLKHERKFNNPEVVNLLIKKLDITLKPKFSLMKGLHDYKIENGEMACDLLKLQNRQLALQNVQKGIALFKEERNQDAILCYNKALSIDEENVEAYVARGALYANDGGFEKSIVDLEKALSIDSSHANAKIYLKEVYLANAVKYEKAHKFENALDYLHRSLELNGENELIRTKIAKIKEIIERIKAEESKDLYGPTLPSKSAKKAKKYKSKSDIRYSKRSPDLEIIRSPRKSRSKYSETDRYSKEPKNSSPSKRQKTIFESIYDRRSQERSKSRDTKQIVSRKEAIKDEESEDEEDLEEFYNKLKKNKVNSKS